MDIRYMDIRERYTKYKCMVPAQYVNLVGMDKVGKRVSFFAVQLYDRFQKWERCKQGDRVTRLEGTHLKLSTHNIFSHKAMNLYPSGLQR